VLETIGKEMAGYSKTPLAQKLGIIVKNPACNATVSLARFETYL
jgi:hypothetical protein